MKNWIYIVMLVVGCKSAQNTSTQVNNVGFAQGTSYNIKYMSNNGKDYHQQIDSIFSVIDSSLSTYVTHSLISQLNTGDTSVILNNHFVRVFKVAEDIYLQSDGLFDCSVAPLVAAWGFGPNKEQDIDSTVIADLLQNIGFEDLTLKGDSLLSNPQLKTLDFNALAQGYTVDVIAEYLDSQLVTNYLIEVGGELRAKGLNSRNKKWRVGIDKPSNEIDKNDRFQIILHLNNKSLATSGNYRNYYEKDGQIFAHTINPKQGYPVQHSLLSATVLADDCMTADAYATTFMVMGVKQTQQFLEEHPELDAFLIYKDSDNQWVNWLSDGLEKQLVN